MAAEANHSAITHSRHSLILSSGFELKLLVGRCLATKVFIGKLPAVGWV